MTAGSGPWGEAQLGHRVTWWSHTGPLGQGQSGAPLHLTAGGGSWPPGAALQSPRLVLGTQVRGQPHGSHALPGALGGREGPPLPGDGLWGPGQRAGSHLPPWAPVLDLSLPLLLRQMPLGWPTSSPRAQAPRPCSPVTGGFGEPRLSLGFVQCPGRNGHGHRGGRAC